MSDEAQLPFNEKDWRIPLCAELARIADESPVPIQRNDRKFIMKKLYELAEAEKNMGDSFKLGALRAVSQYTFRGLAQICTKAIGMRKIQTPSFIHEEIDNAVSTDRGDSVITPEKQEVLKPISLAVILPPEPVECVYGLLLDKEYPAIGVLPLIRDYLAQLYKSPQIAIVDKCERAGLRHDVLVRQNVDNFPVVRSLKAINWVRDVISKPVTMFGEALIAAD